MHSSILLFVVFMGVLGWGGRATRPPLTRCARAHPFWHFVPPPPCRGSLSSRGAF